MIEKAHKPSRINKPTIGKKTDLSPVSILFHDITMLLSCLFSFDQSQPELSMIMNVTF